MTDDERNELAERALELITKKGAGLVLVVNENGVIIKSNAVTKTQMLLMLARAGHMVAAEMTEEEMQATMAANSQQVH